jgi:hypothetical protein
MGREIPNRPVNSSAVHVSFQFRQVKQLKTGEGGFKQNFKMMLEL